MDQNEEQTATTHADVFRHSKIILILLGCALLAAILIGFSPLSPPQNDSWSVTVSEPERALLGTWQKMSWVRGDETGEFATDTPEYIGLVINDEDHVWRDYDSGMSTSSLYSVTSWSVEQAGDRLILKVYDSGRREYVDQTYSIWMPSRIGDELVLTEMNEDGTLHDPLSQIHLQRVRTAEEEASMDFSYAPQELREVCDAALYPDQPATAVLLPITCEVKIGEGEDATITVTEHGDIEVSQNGNVLARYRNYYGEEGVVDTIGYRKQFLDNGVIELRDVTYDGYKDLTVRAWAAAYNIGYSYYAYDSSKHTFNVTPLIEASNSFVDEENRTITSYHKGRGLGDLYSLHEYRFENGSYVLVYEEIQDWAGALEDDYVRTVRELVNGKMVETKREYRTYEDVRGEEE